MNGQGTANGGLAMVLSPDGTFTNAVNLANAVPLSLDQWLHVAGTYQPGQSMKIYLNGMLLQQLTTGVPNQLFNSNSDLWMGLQFDSSAANHLPGIIDEVALYNRALSASEILEHYLAASTLAGDYNNDGVVNAADYVAWRNASSSAAYPTTRRRASLVRRIMPCGGAILATPSRRGVVRQPPRACRSRAVCCWRFWPA